MAEKCLDRTSFYAIRSRYVTMWDTITSYSYEIEPECLERCNYTSVVYLGRSMHSNTLYEIGKAAWRYLQERAKTDPNAENLIGNFSQALEIDPKRVSNTAHNDLITAFAETFTAAALNTSNVIAGCSQNALNAAKQIIAFCGPSA